MIFQNKTKASLVVVTIEQWNNWWSYSHKASMRTDSSICMWAIDTFCQNSFTNTIRLFLFILKASVTIFWSVFPGISSCTVYSISNFICLYLKIAGCLNLFWKTVTFEPIGRFNLFPSHSRRISTTCGTSYLILASMKTNVIYPNPHTGHCS